MNILRFAKDWALPIAMLAGAALYFFAAALPLPPSARSFCLDCISTLQPALIFVMLFITFSKVDASDISIHRWHFAGLAFQCVLFCLLGLLAVNASQEWRVIIVGAMLCFICPTATAAAVVTQKLGGNAGQISTYTVLINIVAAFTVSIVFPLIHPQQGMDFWVDFGLINARVMPMLLMPVVAALIVRRFMPSVPRFFKRYPDIAFYIWCFALALAIAVTVRSIVHSAVPLFCQVGIAVASAIACIVQFAAGRHFGSTIRPKTAKLADVQSCKITAGQSLGQKNTVVAIWMGYTFLDPITSIAGGFYSIWHNLFNSWQLYQMRKKD